MERVGPGTYVEMKSYRSGDDPASQLKAFRKAAPGASVQTLDLSAVGGRMHILLTLKQTEELRGSSQLLADRAEVDFLLRVAGTRQISVAVRAAGSQARRRFSPRRIRRGGGGAQGVGGHLEPRQAQALLAQRAREEGGCQDQARREGVCDRGRRGRRKTAGRKGGAPEKVAPSNAF